MKFAFDWHFPLAVPEQFQSSFRAVSEQFPFDLEISVLLINAICLKQAFSTGSSGAVSEQFQSSFGAVSI